MTFGVRNTVVLYQQVFDTLLRMYTYSQIVIVILVNEYSCAS